MDVKETKPAKSGAVRKALKGYDAICRAALKPLIQWRARRIARSLKELFQPGETVLDFGTGDGVVARALVAECGCAVTGLDTISYGDIGIPFQPYDGSHIPFEDSSFDTVTALFALHHTNDPARALEECRRVARRRLVVIEEVFTNRVQEVFTKAEDWIANRLLSGEVDIPLNFRSPEAWKEIFTSLGLKPAREKRLRPLPFVPLRTVAYELLKSV